MAYWTVTVALVSKGGKSRWPAVSGGPGLRAFLGCGPFSAKTWKTPGKLEWLVMQEREQHHNVGYGLASFSRFPSPCFLLALK